MTYVRKCEKCIWFDQCHQDAACDDFEPAAIEELEDMEVAEYEADLRMRQECYQEEIDEYNG